MISRYVNIPVLGRSVVTNVLAKARAIGEGGETEQVEAYCSITSLPRS
jgi:hypothetical protein